MIVYCKVLHTFEVRPDKSEVASFYDLERPVALFVTGKSAQKPAGPCPEHWLVVLVHRCVLLIVISYFHGLRRKEVENDEQQKHACRNVGGCQHDLQSEGEFGREGRAGQQSQ